MSEGKHADASSNFGLIVGALILGAFIHSGLVHMGHDISGWESEHEQAGGSGEGE